MADGDPPTHLDAELDEILIGGRERPAGGRLTIADYHEGWPEEFAGHQQRIAAALGPLARSIEHIGSTSVPGLAAKPIIDILVAVDDPDDDGPVGPAMDAAGYEVRVREPGHRMYRTPARDVHVHFWGVGSDEANGHLRFRDWLRDHPDDRLLYEQTKRGLAAQPWPDMNYYADAKGPVIADIMARANTDRNGGNLGR